MAATDIESGLGALRASALERRAGHLGDHWRALRSGHVLLAAGCGCGLTGVHVSFDAFEEDLKDYLRVKWAVEPAFLTALEDPIDGITALLDLASASGLAFADRQAMVSDVARAVGSFGRHRR